MISISILKAVPEKTTKVVSVGGRLDRERMSLVMNPHDKHAIEAADYVKRKIGGKVVAISMGPDVKLSPIMKKIYDFEVEGIDENFIISDRAMAGADTLATAYAVALGIKYVLNINKKAINQLIKTIKDKHYTPKLKSLATQLYQDNLIPNSIFSSLPIIKNNLIENYINKIIDEKTVINQLTKIQKSMNEFIIFAGIKTTDGETGSVGPQVAETLSEELGVTIPHITYVHDFEFDVKTKIVKIKRKIANSIQVIETKLPVLLTIDPECKFNTINSINKKLVRLNSYRTKIFKSQIVEGKTLSADYDRLGIPGSPTWVGPGIDVGKPAVQKFLNKSYVFVKDMEQFDFENKKYGPYSVGDVTNELPDSLFKKFLKQNLIDKFKYNSLISDLFNEE